MADTLPPMTPEQNAATFAKLKDVYRGHPNEVRKLRRLLLEGKSMRLGKCVRCPERATVEISRLRAGKLTSQEYCLECAARAGIAIHAGAVRAARRERLARDRGADPPAGPTAATTARRKPVRKSGTPKRASSKDGPTTKPTRKSKRGRD